MHHEFFGLIHRPFVHGPAEHFYSTAETATIVSRLQRVLTARDGVAVVTGGPGVGKSALVHRAVLGLGDAITIAHVDTRHIETEDLLNAVLLAIDPDLAPSSPLRGARLLRDLMQRFAEEGRRIAVAIDVNALTLEIAKGMMRVAHIAGAQGNQLNMIIQGPHALHQQLDLPALIQLRQRVSFRHRVRPLTLEETDQYIRAQIRAAGGDDVRMVTQSAPVAVYCFVAGVPRLINTLMDATLGEAALQNISRPDGSLVKQSADALGWKALSPATPDLQPAKRPATSIGQTGIVKVVDAPSPIDLLTEFEDSTVRIDTIDPTATGMIRVPTAEERRAANS
jgi:MSHA biogenesis protein MshM